MNEIKWAVGQDVVVSGMAWGGQRVAKIEKVTPTGRAKIGSTFYDKFGREIGGSTWHRERINPATREMVEKINRVNHTKRIVSRLSDNTMMSGLPYAKLKRIEAILDEAEAVKTGI